MRKAVGVSHVINHGQGLMHGLLAAAVALIPENQ